MDEYTSGSERLCTKYIPNTVWTVPDTAALQCQEKVKLSENKAATTRRSAVLGLYRVRLAFSIGVHWGSLEFSSPSEPWEGRISFIYARHDLPNKCWYLISLSKFFANFEFLFEIGVSKLRTSASDQLLLTP